MSETICNYLFLATTETQSSLALNVFKEWKTAHRMTVNLSIWYKNTFTRKEHKDQLTQKNIILFFFLKERNRGKKQNKAKQKSTLTD